MAIIRFLFITMTIRFFKAVRDPATRLLYCLPAPLFVIGGGVLVFMRQPPALSLTLFIVGTSAMRVQASMIETRRGTSFRNGGLILIVMNIFFIVLDDYLWAPIGIVVGFGLLAMQRYHDQASTQQDYRSQIARAQQAQAHLHPEAP